MVPDHELFRSPNGTFYIVSRDHAGKTYITHRVEKRLLSRHDRKHQAFHAIITGEADNKEYPR